MRTETSTASAEPGPQEPGRGTSLLMSSEEVEAEDGALAEARASARGSLMHDLHRIHDVSGLTAGELDRAKRDLQVSLSLACPGSPVREPILAQMSAVE